MLLYVVSVLKNNNDDQFLMRRREEEEIYIFGMLNVRFLAGGTYNLHKPPCY